MPRRPHKTDEAILELARKLKAKYGIVTVSALRAAAGGGSPNRLKRLIEAMQPDAAPLNGGAPTTEAEGARVSHHGALGNGASATEDAIGSDMDLVRLTARLQALQETHDHLMDLLREERQGRRGEIETLSRLIERQNALIDQLGRMMELALKTTQQDLRAMREEFNQVTHRMASRETRSPEHRH